MNRRALIRMTAVLALCLARAASAQDAMTRRIDALIAGMTPEEKAGQLTILGDDRPDLDALVKAGLGGANGVIPSKDVPAFTLRTQKLAMQSRLKIPIWFMGDVAHGFQTMFPVPLALAATWDTGLVTRVHRAAGIEATAAGVDWTFSPMVDIARDPRWGRIVESAGEDPYLGAQMALAQMRGFQGDDLSEPKTMLATAKHFAGYGAVQAGRDYNAADIPERVFRDVYLPPFKAVAEAGIGAIMPAFVTLDGVPATSDRTLLTDTLRGRWGYKGVTVSDYDAVPEIVKHGVAAGVPEAVAMALHAGVDIDLHSGSYLAELPRMIRNGRVPVAEVDAAVRRVLSAKYRLGLFDDPYRYNDPKRAAMTYPDHVTLARQAARETMVLLRNDGTLPLKRSGRIAVIGPMAEATRDLLGVMPALGRAEAVVPILDAIRAATAGRAQVSHAAGVPVDGPGKDGIAAATAAARAADVVVLVVGESTAMIGEGNSRASLDLPGRQMALAEAVVATGKPVVAVIVSGRPLDLSWLDGHAAAIVEAWLPGEQGGPALADLLFGDGDFSGRLPVTFPRALGQVPLTYDQPPTARPPDPKDHYTSHYVDLPNTPLYPFGYGLGYARFRYDAPHVDRATLDPGGTLNITARVTNESARAGSTVVQLYVHDRIASVSPPVRQLKRFARITLGAGEARDVTFMLTPADLAFVRRDRLLGTEAGEYDVYTGGDSDAPASARFTLSKGETFDAAPGEWK